jgi:hypothetical protein
MPHDAAHLTLPDDLRAALDAVVDSESQQQFVVDALRTAVRHHTLGTQRGDMGLEPWWPLHDVRFLLLSSGDIRLDDRDEE